MTFNNDFKPTLLALGISLSAAFFADAAAATDRHFTYTYESAGLPAHGRELELWTTNRVGRELLYNRFDQRLEFEYGFTDRLLSAFYLNTTAAVEKDDAGVTHRSYDFAGISSEWKYKLSDAFADALGSALYFEASYAPDLVELEGKIILDKRAGPLLLALNGVYAFELEGPGDENKRDHEVEADLGLAYFFTPHVSLGMEGRGHGIIGKQFEAMAFFAGPVMAWSSEHVWTSLGVLGQIGAVHGPTAEGEPAPKPFAQELHDHEKFNARLLVGWHL